MESQLENQPAQQEKQETPNPAPPKATEAPIGDKDAPKYTEAQWSKMRKTMQLRINELESDRNTLSARGDTLEAESEALKSTLVELKKEIDDGIPEDAEDVVKQYRKKMTDLAVKQAEHKSEVSKWETRLAEVDKSDREELAQTLSTKFGVDVDVLLGEPTPEKMKAYAADNFDSTKIKMPEAPEVEEGEKLDKPPVPSATNIPADTSWRDLSPSEKLRRGIEQKK